jgi:hypothetical protein
VAVALALVVLAVLAFRGLATAMGSWLILAGSLLALAAVLSQLVRRR